MPARGLMPSRGSPAGAGPTSVNARSNPPCAGQGGQPDGGGDDAVGQLHGGRGGAGEGGGDWCVPVCVLLGGGSARPPCRSPRPLVAAAVPGARLKLPVTPLRWPSTRCAPSPPARCCAATPRRPSASLSRCCARRRRWASALTSHPARHARAGRWAHACAGQAALAGPACRRRSGAQASLVGGHWDANSPHPPPPPPGPGRVAGCSRAAQ